MAKIVFLFYKYIIKIHIIPILTQEQRDKPSDANI